VNPRVKFPLEQIERRRITVNGEEVVVYYKVLTQPVN